MLNKTFKPALRGSWYLFFGALLGPTIILTDRDPENRIWLWLLMTLLFLGLIIHRLSLSYVVSEGKLTVLSWWGLGQPESLTLNLIEEATVKESLTSKIASLGHIMVRSSDPNESSLVILAQKNPEKLARQLLEQPSQPAIGDNGIPKA